MTPESPTPRAHGPTCVFVSYRRNDAPRMVGHIYERLVEHFGTDQVVLDLEPRQPGVDYAEALEREIGRCPALLAVIGRNWLTMTGPTGQPRIYEPSDYVRLEIEAALVRRIHVLPVLVDSAVMPEPHELPESLAALARRQPIKVRRPQSNFTVDVGGLIQSVEATVRPGPPASHAAAIPKPRTSSPPVEPRHTRGGSRWRAWISRR